MEAPGCQHVLTQPAMLTHLSCPSEVAKGVAWLTFPTRRVFVRKCPKPRGLTYQQGGHERADTAAGHQAPNWAEINAASRRKAAQWCATRPLGRFVMIRLIMKPWRALLQSYMDSAGEAWETAQRCIEAKHVVTGQEVVDSTVYVCSPF